MELTKIEILDRDFKCIKSISLKSKDYDFNKHLVSNGYVKGVVLYGTNNSGVESIISALKGHNQLGLLRFVFDNNETCVFDCYLQEVIGKTSDEIGDYIKNHFFDEGVNTDGIWSDTMKSMIEDFGFSESDRTRQFYDIARVLNHINRAKKHGLKLIVESIPDSIDNRSATKLLQMLIDSNIPFIVSSYNTHLMTNDLLRPDCYFDVRKDDVEIKCLVDLTDKELREAHNLEKLYNANEFGTWKGINIQKHTKN